MGAYRIDGKAEAQLIKTRVAAEVATLKASQGIEPGLAVVLVGDNPASEVYVRNKVVQTKDAGMKSFEYRLPASLPEEDLLKLILDLNARSEVNGILIQLPLPSHISVDKVIAAISPEKDVDGLHPTNAGLLALGKPGLVPCTPLGCVALAKSVRADLRGLEVVVVGRSQLVGRPAAQLFIAENCTVTVAHSGTRDLPAVCRRADILVVAVGRPKMVKQDWIKPLATIIDVGINRVPKEGGGSCLVGDVDLEGSSLVAGAITPVPGGVGPMTIAYLLSNAMSCTKMQLGAPPPAPRVSFSQPRL